MCGKFLEDNGVHIPSVLSTTPLNPLVPKCRRRTMGMIGFRRQSEYRIIVFISKNAYRRGMIRIYLTSLKRHLRFDLNEEDEDKDEDDLHHTGKTERASERCTFKIV